MENLNLGLTYLITTVFEMEKKTENEQLILTQFAISSENVMFFYYRSLKHMLNIGLFKVNQEMAFSRF